MTILSRRAFVTALAGTPLTAIVPSTLFPSLIVAARAAPMPDFYGPVPSEPFPIPAVPTNTISPAFWRQSVSYPSREAPGTIIVNPANRYLYLVQGGGSALRYGVGVGRDGFAWSGRARVGRKADWPKWTPPASMIARQPELAPYSAANGGYPPGPNNPLGARALYLFRGGKDTLYRIHGTNEPWSIGQAMSSGCIRMLNQDVIDLYRRVAVGARVIVRGSAQPTPQSASRTVGRSQRPSSRHRGLY